MELWKKPNIVIYNKTDISKLIKAKAYTVGEAMSIGELCDQGVGAVGVIQLPDGMIVEAYVAAKNEVEGFYTLIINGIKRFWNWLTGIFT